MEKVTHIADSRHTILVVDDDPINLEILSYCLEEKYEVVYLDASADCIHKVIEIMPDLILMDINMPDVNGIEICRTLKEKADTQYIPVIFVTASGMLDDKLEGYDVGAADYITKPFESEEVLVKLNIILKGEEEKKLLKQETNSVSHLLLTAMTDISLYGIVINFLQDSISSTTINSVAKHLLAATNSLGAQCSLQLRGINGAININAGGIYAPTDDDLLSRCATSSERFIEKGRKLIVTHESVSALVNHIHVPNSGDYEQMKDILNILLGVANSKIQFLNIEYLEVTEPDVNKDQRMKRTANAMDNILMHSDDIMAHMNLTEKQKVELGSLINKRMEQLVYLYKDSKE